MLQSCFAQLCAIRDQAEVLVASGQADTIIADKKHKRDEAWFEMASAFPSSYTVDLFPSSRYIGFFEEHCCGKSKFATCRQ